MVNRLEKYLKDEQSKKKTERDQKTESARERAEKAGYAVTPGANKQLTMSKKAWQKQGEEEERRQAEENLLAGQKKVYDPKKQDEEAFNVEQLRELVDTKYSAAQVFTQEEMKLISFAFKSQIAEIKEALNNIDILRQKSKFENQKGCLDQYRQGLISDMIQKCQHQNRIVVDHCIPVVGSLMPLIFFKKLIADNYKHMTTVTEKDPTQRGEYKKEALKHYQEALFISDKLSLDKISNTDGGDTIDFLRLGLKLNYAIFLHDIMLQKKDAIR